MANFMKIVRKDIFDFQEKNFFFAIRNKIDYARLIAYSTRLLLLDFAPTETNSFFKLIVDKMSRLFFYKSDKYFSVAFPFSIVLVNDKISEISTYNGTQVDNKNISEIISILEDENFKIKPSPLEFYMDAENIDTSSFLLLEEIFQFEPGYIRYDYDQINENGKIHPLYHFDVNYSSYNTYKIGLNSALEVNRFEDILDINTKCGYITE